VRRHVAILEVPVDEQRHRRAKRIRRMLPERAFMLVAEWDRGRPLQTRGVA
jgi:hypothetical protein